MTRSRTDTVLIVAAVGCPLAALATTRHLLVLLVLTLVVPLLVSLYGSIRLVAATARRPSIWAAFLVPVAVSAMSLACWLSRESLVG